MDEHKLKKLTKQVKALQHKICCLIEQGFDFSDLPEYADNDAAIADGLDVGDKYRTPLIDNRSYLCVVVTPPAPDPVILRILTNDGGSSLPFYDSASFASYFIGYNPSLNVTSYELVGDELTVIGTGFESIAESTFESYTSIVEVESETATTIKDKAFKGCTFLTDISFPSAKTIGDEAFKDCMALTEVNLTNFPAVTYWGDNALYGCASLTLFETNATTVRPGILDYCGSLEEVKLNNATALFNIFGAYGAYNNTVPMLFRMPNLNNFIDDPFGVLINNGVINSGTDFTIEIPSAMTGNARILEVQAIGATIVDL